jgi:excisionase family DNA binding protein
MGRSRSAEQEDNAMPRTKANQRMRTTRARPVETTSSVADAGTEVLTLAEAAVYLRLTEAEVLQLVSAQRLPGRKIGEDWRFWKAALQNWLCSPPSRKEALLLQIGAFKDDPDLETMLKEIYRQRGRPITEEG